MNLGNLRTMTRVVVPGAKLNVISNAVLDLMLNNGAIDVATYSACLQENTKFDVVANQSEYNLSSVVSRFLVIAKEGLWYRDSATDNYKRLYPRTMKWLNENRPYWRDEDAGVPQYYYQDGNNLGLVPAPDGAVDEGLWLYFGQKPQAMNSTIHWPFGYGAEITRLAPLSECIVAYAEWKLVKALNAGQDAYKAKETAYKTSLAEKISLISRRSDISSDKKTKYGGRIV